MADFSDLQREWDAQPEYSEKRMSEIAQLVRTRSDSLRAMLVFRDLSEGIAGVIVSAVFAGYWIFNPALLAPNLIAKTGIVISIAGSIGVNVWMQFVRRRRRVDFGSVPLKEFVASEVESVDDQVALLRHVAWWYLAPLYIGTCVYVFGLSTAGEWDPYRLFFIGYCLFAFVLYWFIWRLNQKVRMATLEPLRDALKRTYDSLESDADGGDPQAEVLSALAKADLIYREGWLGRIKYQKPSKLKVATIILATVGGGLGLAFYPLPGMGPVFFQALVGAVLGFEITFFGFVVRLRPKEEQREPS